MSCSVWGNITFGLETPKPKKEIPTNSRAGERNGRAKLSEAQVRAIKADKRSYRVIGKEYGVGVAHVHSIKKGTRWANLNNDTTEKEDGNGQG